MFSVANPFDLLIPYTDFCVYTNTSEFCIFPDSFLLQNAGIKCGVLGITSAV